MLIKSVQMYFKKKKLYFFMEEPHPTVLSIEMADALSNYISNYKFQFKFNLKIENCKF